ncbi:unnamed protein product [Lactuca saligna]|uniref:WAP domain-containing protein n=1 Tax=Lactuca saligna TaxID=75948 RepID=A0AA35YSS6_LACSI|nr:unnamed protein product [Lactuca saligna]
MVNLFETCIMMFCISFLVLFPCHQCNGYILSNVGAGKPPKCNIECKKVKNEDYCCCGFEDTPCSGSLDVCIKNCAAAKYCCVYTNYGGYGSKVDIAASMVGEFDVAATIFGEAYVVGAWAGEGGGGV